MKKFNLCFLFVLFYVGSNIFREGVDFAWIPEYIFLIGLGLIAGDWIDYRLNK